MSFGCVYVPRFDRCQKSPNVGDTDERCQIQGDRCAAVPNSKNITVAPKPTPIIPATEAPRARSPSRTTSPVRARSPSPKVVTLPGATRPGSISGPVSAYAYSYKGKRYYMFGDHHFSFKGACPGPCHDMITMYEGQERIDINEDLDNHCYDITALLSKIFREAEKADDWVDLFLEFPYEREKTPFFIRRKPDDNIAKIYDVFWKAFRNQSQLYNTTRFHAVDVRLKFDANSNTESNSYWDYLALRALYSAEHVLMLSYEGKYVANNYVENTDILIRDFYQGGQTLAGTIVPKYKRMFKAIVESENYYDEVLNIFQDLLARITDEVSPDKVTWTAEALRNHISQYLTLPGVVSLRDGKYMHKTAIQLYELNKENPEMAQLIKNYIFSKADHYDTENKLLQYWDKFMKMYDAMTGRDKKMGELSKVNMDLLQLVGKFKEQQSHLAEVIKYDALTMDAYLLARLFRTYRGQHHVDSKIAIMYAGDEHIKTYVEFFRDMLHAPGKNYPAGPEIHSRCVAVDLSDFTG